MAQRCRATKTRRRDEQRPEHDQCGKVTVHEQVRDAPKGYSAEARVTRDPRDAIDRSNLDDFLQAIWRPPKSRHGPKRLSAEHFAAVGRLAGERTVIMWSSTFLVDSGYRP